MTKITTIHTNVGSPDADAPLCFLCLDWLKVTSVYVRLHQMVKPQKEKKKGVICSASLNCCEEVPFSTGGRILRFQHEIFSSEFYFDLQSFGALQRQSGQ